MTAKIELPEFGARVVFTERLERISIGAAAKKIWRPRSQPAAEGIYVGWRTLANGDNEYLGEGEGEGVCFKPTEYVRAALVAFDPRRRPVFVPIEALEVVEGEAGATRAILRKASSPEGES